MKKEWIVTMAFPKGKKKIRDNRYKKLVKLHGTENVSLGNDPNYRKFGSVLPYQILRRAGYIF